MKKEIKVIALDLDGTLLTNDKKITLENQVAIQKAKEAGIKIVLCTGRPLKGILPYLEELELLGEEDYSINYNGGLIQQTKSGAILYEQAHSKADMQFCYEETQKVGLPLVMIDRETVYETTPPENRPSIYPAMQIIPVKQANPSDFEDSHTFNKAVLCIEEELLNQGMKELSPAFYERFTCVKSRTFLLEVLPKNVSKGNGLIRLAELLGIQLENIMACGDEENDLSMLEVVGFPVAMGNATPEVKAVCSYVTKTNEESGVAQAIYHILEN